MLLSKRWGVLISNDLTIFNLRQWLLNYLRLNHVSWWVELILAFWGTSHEGVGVLRRNLKLLSDVDWLFRNLLIFSMDLLSKVFFIRYLRIIHVILSSWWFELIVQRSNITSSPIALLSYLSGIFLSLGSLLVEFWVTWQIINILINFFLNIFDDIWLLFLVVNIMLLWLHIFFIIIWVRIFLDVLMNILFLWNSLSLLNLRFLLDDWFKTALFVAHLIIFGNIFFMNLVLESLLLILQLLLDLSKLVSLLQVFHIHVRAWLLKTDCWSWLMLRWLLSLITNLGDWSMKHWSLSSLRNRSSDVIESSCWLILLVIVVMIWLDLRVRIIVFFLYIRAIFNFNGLRNNSLLWLFILRHLEWKLISDLIIKLLLDWFFIIHLFTVRILVIVGLLSSFLGIHHHFLCFVDVIIFAFFDWIFFNTSFHIKCFWCFWICRNILKIFYFNLFGGFLKLIAKIWLFIVSWRANFARNELIVVILFIAALLILLLRKFLKFIIHIVLGSFVLKNLLLSLSNHDLSDIFDFIIFLLLSLLILFILRLKKLYGFRLLLFWSNNFLDLNTRLLTWLLYNHLWLLLCHILLNGVCGLNGISLTPVVGIFSLTINILILVSHEIIKCSVSFTFLHHFLNRIKGSLWRLSNQFWDSATSSIWRSKVVWLWVNLLLFLCHWTLLALSSINRCLFNSLPNWNKLSNGNVGSIHNHSLRLLGVLVFEKIVECVYAISLLLEDGNEVIKTDVS